MNEFLREHIPAWESASSSLQLSGAEIHVWALDRSIFSVDWPNAIQLLSEEEINRAQRLVREADRYQFALSRKGLRVLLAAYLNRPPGEIQITNSTKGKPQLAESDDEKPPAFSLSHAGSWTLYAIRKAGMVGIDVETHAKKRQEDQLASRYFSDSEKAWLQTLPDPARYQAFLSLWTLKEAYLKATGEGIVRGLNEFSVGWQEKEKKFVLCLPHKPSNDWQMESFLPAPGYQAGLAFDHPPCLIRFFQFKF